MLLMEMVLHKPLAEVLELVEAKALLIHVLLCHDFQALGGEHFSCVFSNEIFA